MSTRDINNNFDEIKKIIGKIERCIEDAWLELKKEQWHLLWWHEDELIMPFYFHVRPCIDKLNEDLERIQLYIIPQYAPKASSYARKLSEKFPLLLEGEKEFDRTKHVDLGIVAFDLHDFRSRCGKSETTIWHIKQEIGIDNLKICYETWHEGDWGIA